MKNRAAEIHASLKHPVIDGDGHWLEPVPVFLEYLCEVGGAQSVDRMRALWQRTHAWYRSTWSERQHNRTRRSNWWGVTSKTLDKATALLPALLNERLPELGIDFALIYPSLGLAFNGIAQDDLRRAAARAYNKMTVDMFAPYAARFAPVAIIPVHTPEEAIEELEYAVGKLGYRAIMLKGNQERPIPSAAEGVDAKKAAWYVDTLALDSPLELRSILAALRRPRRRRDPTLGQRPLAGSRLHQQLHLQPYRPLRRIESRLREGRFPGRSGAALPEPQFRLHGRRRELGLSVVRRPDRTLGEAPPCRLTKPRRHQHRRDASFYRPVWRRETESQCRRDHEQPGLSCGRNAASKNSRGRSLSPTISPRQESSQKRIFGRLFSTNFYFGCEADDRTTMWAFDPRMGFRLRPVFSSDFTHFDVPDFARGHTRSVRDGREGLRHRTGFSRVHLHQCRKAAHAQQSGLLQGYRCRASGGR